VELIEDFIATTRTAEIPNQQATSQDPSGSEVL
jgi:hypothetical protein